MAEFEDSDSSDDEGASLQCAVLKLLEQNNQACQAIALAHDLFFSSEREFPSADFSVNTLRPKIDRLGHLMEGHSSIFRTVTGFTMSKFDRLCNRVCPVMAQAARHTGERKQIHGRPSKLDPKERLLSFLCYVKHNTGCRYEASHWNYSRSSLNDDVPFIASAINVALADEIQWPDAQRREALSRRLPDWPGCIGHIDGTLCRIKRPQIRNHTKYYNGRKAMYCFNNVMIIDHDGLFIYVHAGFPGSLHDANCARKSYITPNWRQYFKNTPPYTRPEQYLLGDPGYLGLEMYIMRRFDRREIVGDLDPVQRAFNRRHAAQRVKVEWGIGGLKNRWRRFLDVCPSRRYIFSPVFEACCRLTNFVHRSRMDFSIVEVGPDQQHDDNVGFANQWGQMED